MAIVECPQCGAKNRVDERRAGMMQPVCGRCGAKLPVVASAGGGGHPVELADATFADELRAAGDLPVLVDCWAPWCGPCRMLTPVIEQLAAEANGQYVVAKLNVDENPGVAGQFRVSSIPTMLVFRRGQLVDQLVGVQPKRAIQERLMGVARA